MRHLNRHSKLGRTGQHRRAMLRNMATSLFLHEKIHTTLGKARVLRPFAERLITLAKVGTLHARRQAAQDIHDHVILQKLFAEVGPRAQSRQGGYTRLLKTGMRRGDNSPTAFVELVDRGNGATATEVSAAAATSETAAITTDTPAQPA